MKKSIQFIIITITLKTFLSLTAISTSNCALLFPKYFSDTSCEDNSYYCQQAKEKSDECNGYTGQKRSDCYAELRNLQDKCMEDIADCNNNSNDKSIKSEVFDKLK